MRVLKIPALFHADNTVYRRGDLHGDLNCWQICVLYTCGVLGYALSALVFIAARINAANLTAGIAIPAVVVTCLSLTLLAWFWLLMRLLKSFDFVFLLVQLVASEVSACDLLQWEWTTCCATFTELLWAIWVLLLDALTPAMKTQGHENPCERSRGCGLHPFTCPRVFSSESVDCRISRSSQVRGGIEQDRIEAHYTPPSSL